MNISGGGQTGFSDGGSIGRFTNTRWMELLQQLKEEVEMASQEIEGYRSLRKEFQSKVEDQMSEMTTMRQAVVDLQNKFLYVKDQYETELHRLREQVMKQTGAMPPTSSFPMSAAHEPELSTLRGGNLPALSDSFFRGQGGIRDGGSGEPSMKKHRSDGLNGPLGGPGKGNVAGNALGKPYMEGTGGPAPGGRGIIDGIQLKEESGAEAGFGADPAQKAVGARQAHPGNTAQQENDYNVVPGRTTNGNLLNMSVKIQNSFPHDSVVCCVRYSWNGMFLATGSNRCAQVFDASTGNLVAKFARDDGAEGDNAPDSYIRAVCFSPDGKWLITGAEDRLVRIWDVRKRTVQHKLAGHDTDIYAVEASSDGKFIVSGSGDKKAKIWDLQTGRLLHALGDGESAPTDGITSVSISSTGNHVAAGSLDKIVRVWDVETGQLLRSFEGHSDSVYSVAFSPDSRTLLSGSLDKTLRLWDLHASSPSNQCKLSFVGHKDFVLSVAFSPNGRLLLSGSKDHSVQFWDPRIPSMCLMLQGHKNSVISIAHSPTGKMFATGSGDARARTWGYSN